MNCLLKLYLVLCLTFLFSIVSHNTLGNSELSFFLDSIEVKYNECKTSNDYKLFFDSLRVYENFLFENLDGVGLINLNKYYSWIPTSKDDSIYFRNRLMYHGYKIKKATGDFNKAHVFYQRSASLWPVDEPINISSLHVEKHLASSFARRNEYDKALYYNLIVSKYLKQEGRLENLSRVYGDIADLYMWLEDYKLMKVYLDKGLDIAINTNNKEAQATHYNNLLEYYNYYSDEPNCDSRFNLIYEKVNNVIKLLNNEQKYTERLFELYSHRANYFSKQGNFLMALSFFRKSEEALVNLEYNTSRDKAKLFFSIAQLYYDQFFHEEAIVKLDSAVCFLISNKHDNSIFELSVDSLNDENTFVDIFSLRAKIEFRYYNDKNEIEHLDNAIDMLEKAIKMNIKLSNKLHLDNSRYISAKLNNDLLDEVLNYLYYGYQRTKDDKYYFLARKYFSLSKGQILNNSISKKVFYQDLNSDDKILLANYENQLLQSQLSISSPLDFNSKEVLLNDSINKLLGKYNFGLLDRKEVEENYIEYFEGRDSYFLLSNINNGIFKKLEGKFLITSIIDSINFRIDNQYKLGLDSLLLELNRKLMPLNLESCDKLIIIPDGKLWTLQFDILRNNDKYLIETCNVLYRSNYYYYDFGLKKNESYNSYVLSPIYEKISMANLNVKENLFFLPFAELEKGYIKESFESNWDSDTIISFNNLKRKLSEVDIFHFAGHGVVTADSSYLALTQRDKRIQKLSDKAISYFSNSLELVVLSACQTGSGLNATGEGVLSLARSFLYSGARSVVYTLWKCNDESSSLLMKDFYKNLNLGQRKSEALRNAKLKYLNNCIPDKRHPYYWASFALNGNNEQLKDKRNFSIFLPLIILLIASFVFLKSKI